MHTVKNNKWLNFILFTKLLACIYISEFGIKSALLIGEIRGILYFHENLYIRILNKITAIYDDSEQPIDYEMSLLPNFFPYKRHLWKSVFP